MLGDILGVLFTIGLVALIFNECVKPYVRKWRKCK